MDKIYGYKMQDVTLLAEYLKNRGNGSLTSIFADYGQKYGKAKGTVRNLYYALAKKSVEDQAFCQKYLQGKPLAVSKIVEFDAREEKQLIKKILQDKSEGKSVRSSIMQMANGDGKIALRYQNKYRNAVKNKPSLIDEAIKELREEGCDLSLLTLDKVAVDGQENERQISQLKREIDGLVNKIAIKIRKENQALKERVCALEKENLKLLKIIYGQTDGVERALLNVNGGNEDILS